MIKFKEKLFDYEFPEVHVTEGTLKVIKNNPVKYSSCDARVRLGLVYTDVAKEKYINKGLRRPLPDSKVKKNKIWKEKLII